MTPNQELIATSEAARILGLSGERVRQLSLAGEIPSIKIEPHGYRAFFRADVERLKAERESKTEAN